MFANDDGTSRVRLPAVLLVHSLVPLVVLVIAVLVALAVPTGAPGAVADGEGDVLGRFFLSASLVLACCLAVGALARSLGQPPVIGEVAAGLALGPSLLGAIAPEVSAWLFPDQVLSRFDGLAQLGLVLFMFEIGRELRSMRMRGTATQSLLVAQSSTLMPLGFGALAALPLLNAFRPEGAHPVLFVLFIGCALSVTALPVLARILQERGLTPSRPGRISLVAASIGDGCGWLLLTAIVAISQGGTGGGALTALVGTVAVVAFFLGPLRALGGRLAARKGSQDMPPDTEDTKAPRTARTLVLLVGAVTAGAALTSAIGVHQLIGALLIGAVWPSGHRATEHAATVISGARTVLLPFFFLGFGLTVDITTIGFDPRMLAALALLLTVAVVAKLLGPGLCAWLTGIPAREALALGALLNARGLTELIVLRIGFEAGLIGQDLFVILTVVALVTTVMTSPLLRLTRFRVHDMDSGGLAPAVPRPDERANPRESPVSR